MLPAVIIAECKHYLYSNTMILLKWNIKSKTLTFFEGSSIINNKNCCEFDAEKLFTELN